MEDPLIKIYEINYIKEWEKTILYRWFNKKQPSKEWMIQLERIYKRKHNWDIKYG